MCCILHTSVRRRMQWLLSYRLGWLLCCLRYVCHMTHIRLCLLYTYSCSVLTSQHKYIMCYLFYTSVGRRTWWSLNCRPKWLFCSLGYCQSAYVFSSCCYFCLFLCMSLIIFYVISLSLSLSLSHSVRRRTSQSLNCRQKWLLCNLGYC